MASPPEKILLVDDEPRLLSGLKRNLGLHFSVLTAQSGQEAIKIISDTEKIGVIVADMQMPGMNGVDLLKQVKEDAPQIRRMMLTGNSDQDTAIAAVNEGSVMRFMRKPCDPTKLKDAINDALDDFRFSTAQDKANAENRGGVVARDSFLSMMNHELRTPLHHIIGLAQLIEIPDGDKANPSHDYLRTMRKSADSLLFTLMRILDFARINSKRKSVLLEDFDFVDLLKDEVDRAKSDAEENKITIAFDTLRRHHTFVGSKNDVGLAVREILSNAVKFNKPGGHVGVTLRCAKENVAVKITDTGVGINESQLNRVTGAFTQADEGRTRPHEGVGLGLSLASLIAEKHGGSISMSSDENKGTSVVLSIVSSPDDLRLSSSSNVAADGT
ncbi:MAG: hybrid sensor histidine kinase/response regulator [Pseudomonadota bacterium]